MYLRASSKKALSASSREGTQWRSPVIRTTYHGNRAGSEHWLGEAAGGLRPLLDVRPIPDKSPREYGDGLGELRVTPAPIVYHLRSFDPKSLCDLR